MGIENGQQPHSIGTVGWFRHQSRAKYGRERFCSARARGGEEVENRRAGVYYKKKEGIRDSGVSGVQRCALPIFDWGGQAPRRAHEFFRVVSTAVVEIYRSTDFWA